MPAIINALETDNAVQCLSDDELSETAGGNILVFKTFEVCLWMAKHLPGLDDR